MFKTFVTGLALLAVLPAFAQKNVTIDGVYERIAIDHEGKAFEVLEQVRDRKTNRILRLKKMSTDHSGRMSSGDRVRVRGRTTSLRTNSGTVAALDLTGAEPITTSVSSTLVQSLPAPITKYPYTVFVRFSDGSTPHMSVSTFSAVAAKTRQLYQEQTFGKIDVNFDKNGDGAIDQRTVTITASRSVCDYNSWNTNVRSALTTAGVSLTGYTNLILILPYATYPACTWAGIGTVGSVTSNYLQTTWIRHEDNPPVPRVTAHELGHNFGLMHASTDPENDGTINVEYGDRSCFMGDQAHGNNGPHKAQLGVLAEASQIFADSNSGTYNISALDIDPSISPYPHVVKVFKKIGTSASNSTFYYLSLKRAVGMYDSNLSSTYTGGVSIHVQTGAGNTLFVRKLSPGQTFYDSVNGVSITTLSMSSGTAQVSVTQNRDFSCAATPTLTSVSSLSLREGESKSVRFTLKNTNPFYCAPKNYTVSASNSSGVSFNFATPSQSVLPGATAYFTADVKGITAGSHSVTASVEGASVTVPVTVVGAPQSPTNLKFTHNFGSVFSLNWVAPIGATSFKVYRMLPGAASYSYLSSASASPASIQSPTLGASYYVTAISNSLESAPSAAVVFNPAAPQAPVNVTVAPDSIHLNLSWAASTSEAGVKYYNIYRKLSTEAAFVKLGYVGSSTLSYLTQTYAASFYVTTLDYLGRESAPSTTASYAPQTLPAPVLSMVSSGGMLNFSWTVNGTAASFKLYRRTATSNMPVSISGTVLNYSLPAPSVDTTFYLTAMSSGGIESPASNEIAYSVASIPKTAAPQNLAYTVSGSYLMFTWSPVPATSTMTYKLYRKLNSASSYSLVASTSSTSYNVVKPSESASYYLTATEYGSLSSDPSNTVDYVMVKLATPANLTLTPTTTSVRLAWEAVSHTSTVSYRIYSKSETASSYTLTSSTSNLYISLSMPAATTSYYVIAYSSGSISSDPSNVVTQTIVKLTTPSGLTLTPSTSSLKLSWGAVTHTSTVTYRIYAKAETASSYGLIASNISVAYYSITLPSVTTSYYITAHAIGAASDPSNVVTHTVVLQENPTNLRISGSYSSISLNWTAASGAVRYVVYRKLATENVYSIQSSSVTGTTFYQPYSGSASYYVTAIKADGSESAASNIVTYSSNIAL